MRHAKIASKAPTSAKPSSHLMSYVSELRQKYHIERRLLLIQAPQFLFESINLEVIRNRGYYAYPPTGLQWIEKALAKRDVTTRILDLNFHILDRIIQDPEYDYNNWLALLDGCLEEFKPAIVGVTCLSVFTDLLNTRHPLTEILRHLKRGNTHIVIAGGPTATNEIEGYLSNDLCHFVIEGEGERRINYLFDVLFDEDGTNPPSAGIHFRYRDTIQQTAGLKRNVELKGNLISTYAPIPVENYCNVGSLNPYSRMSGQNKIYGLFQLNRGCRGNCKFCGVRSFMGRGIRTYPVEDVLEEMYYLAEQRGVRHFELLDDDFLARPEAVKMLLKSLTELRQRMGITWSANNGFIATSIDEELLELMNSSGCMGFKIGIESGNPQMLEKMKKPGNIPAFTRAAKLIQGYPELFVGGNYIIGLFGQETFGQMLDTFRLSCRLNLDWSSFTLYQVTTRPQSSSEHSKSPGGGATDFIPAKDSSDRDIQNEMSFPLGPGLFDLPEDFVPSREQMRNIWFTFNLVGNYINNKNLKPGGNPHKFVSWLEAVQVAYPNNPYMHLFAGLGHVLTGNLESAHGHMEQCKAIVSDSKIWTHRFGEFGLQCILADFPINEVEVFEKLATISNRRNNKPRKTHGTFIGERAK